MYRHQLLLYYRRIISVRDKFNSLVKILYTIIIIYTYKHTLVVPSPRMRLRTAGAATVPSLRLFIAPAYATTRRRSK